MSARRQQRPRTTRYQAEAPVSAQPTSAQKRRRVEPSSTTGVTRPVTRTRSTVLGAALNTAKACTSCHRKPARLDEMLECSRCATAMCGICSRTCTQGVPPSLPPTPALSYTSTPGSESSYATAHATLPPPPVQAVSNKRRRVEDEQDELLLRLDAAHLGIPIASVSTTGGSSSSRTLTVLPEDSDDGCQRVVCKSCAIENRDTDASYTCLDCFGLPLHIPPRVLGLQTFSTDYFSASHSPSPRPSFSA